MLEESEDYEPLRGKFRQTMDAIETKMFRLQAEKTETKRQLDEVVAISRMNNSRRDQNMVAISSQISQQSERSESMIQFNLDDPQTNAEILLWADSKAYQRLTEEAVHEKQKHIERTLQKQYLSLRQLPSTIRDLQVKRAALTMLCLQNGWIPHTDSSRRRMLPNSNNFASPMQF